jgi:hypothetical protein
MGCSCSIIHIYIAHAPIWSKAKLQRLRRFCMLPRYTLEPMRVLWAEETKFRKWLEIETAILRARGDLGEVPPDLWQTVTSKA